MSKKSKLKFPPLAPGSKVSILNMMSDGTNIGRAMWCALAAAEWEDEYVRLVHDEKWTQKAFKTLDRLANAACNNLRQWHAFRREHCGSGKGEGR